MKKETHAFLIVTWGFHQSTTRRCLEFQCLEVFIDSAKLNGNFTSIPDIILCCRFIFLEGCKWGLSFVCSYHLLLFNFASLLETKDMHMICINKQKRAWAAFQRILPDAQANVCGVVENTGQNRESQGPALALPFSWLCFSERAA